jgi:hypothetical protein
MMLSCADGPVCSLFTGSLHASHPPLTFLVDHERRKIDR